jgi:hypothetical protein
MPEGDPEHFTLSYRVPAARARRRWTPGLAFLWVCGCIAAVNGLLFVTGLATDSLLIPRMVTLLNLPATPCVIELVRVFPPPMGESESTSWDYGITAATMLLGSCAWGAVAAATVWLMRLGEPK